MRRSVPLAALLMTVLTSTVAAAGAGPAPSRERPYFMPERRRQEILNSIREEPWAREAYAKTKAAAEKGDSKWSDRAGGFWAAFLYALEGDPKHLDVAQKWLSKGWGIRAAETVRKKKLLETPENWNGPENSVDWYLLDAEAYVAFDWVYRGLPDEARRDVHDGLATQTRYRMACMDSWGSTPNLNFKPISMIALGALALQDEDIMRWAFQRTVRQGSYVSMLDRMIRGGGPWHEAPIYAIAHKSLWCMSTVALYGRLYDGRDWYAEKLPRGGSPKGLMDYYLDTAYPIERGGAGPERIRIATYGDGSTGIKGGTTDHFLSDLADELALAYAITGDDRYAAFLAMRDDYQPNLWDRRPLPQDKPRYPAAASRIWGEFGVAMLRSDESPGYWANPDAIAVLQVMTQGYGHDHRDKFGIILFGANRLLYPDYLGLQYELFSMGWTNTPVAHNTMMVDDQDTENAPVSIRHDFTPDVKFLATSSGAVYEGVDQTRALLLSGEYLLDLFAASSKVPHTYDYILNSLGQPQPGKGVELPSTKVISPRYWALDEPRTGASSGPWSLDFVLEEQQHEAKMRVTVAADRDTRIGCGSWGPGKFAERARLIHGERELRDRWRGAKAQKLGTLVARRENRRATVFAAAHEPYANGATPRVRAVKKVAEGPDAVVVRVEGEGFTDYAAVAWGDDAKSPLHVLAAGDDAGQVFAFRNYGYLRVKPTGELVARGGWSGLRLPLSQAGARLVLNGQQQQAVVQEGRLKWGEVPRPQVVAPDPESPFPLTPTPALARLAPSAKRQVSITLANTLQEPVSGTVEFDLPAGISVGRAPAQFGPVQPGQSLAIPVTLDVGAQAITGRRTLPFRLLYRLREGDEVRTQYVAMPAVVGTSVRADRTRSETVVDTVGYSTRLNSQTLEHTYLADPDGNVRHDGGPLFTIADEQGKQVVPVLPSGQAWLSTTSISTAAGQSARYRTEYRPSRIELPYVTKAYTRMTEAHFTLPGNWISPAGPPRWKRIIAVDEQGKEYDAQPGQEARIVAAELEFPQSAWNLALAFTPARQVQIDGMKARFALPIREPETWAIGFCKPGSLDEWRRVGKPAR